MRASIVVSMLLVAPSVYAQGGSQGWFGQCFRPDCTSSSCKVSLVSSGPCCCRTFCDVSGCICLSGCVTNCYAGACQNVTCGIPNNCGPYREYASTGTFGMTLASMRQPVSKDFWVTPDALSQIKSVPADILKRATNDLAVPLTNGMSKGIRSFLDEQTGRVTNAFRFKMRVEVKNSNLAVVDFVFTPLLDDPEVSVSEPPESVRVTIHRNGKVQERPLTPNEVSEMVLIACEPKKKTLLGAD